MTAQGKRSTLEARFATIAPLLEKDLDRQWTLPAGLGQITHWDVVGVGASEAPARLTVSALLGGGRQARFAGISEFLWHEDAARAGSGLVIFSQGLSPNAQLALSAARHYQAAVLVTAVTEASRAERRRFLTEFPGHVLSHSPESEAGTLIRLVGPVCASLVALRLCAAILSEMGAPAPWETALGEVPRVYDRWSQADVPSLGGDPQACLALGQDATLAQCLMWKWQEGLYTRLPLACDALAFAHGPLQSFFETRGTFITLVRDGDPIAADVFSRLRASLHPTRHHQVAFRSSLPGPVAYFDFDAQLAALLLSEVRARGIDPESWPGQGADGPLYSLFDPKRRT